MSDLTIVLGGLALPDQAQLVETTTPIEVDIQTLGGTLYTDFTAYRRSWSALLPPVCRDDFNAIYAIYRAQYTNGTYTTLVCAALGISTIVKVNISDQDLHWNGDQIQAFSLTLKEQIAIS